MRASKGWQADKEIHACRGVDLNLARGKTLALSVKADRARPPQPGSPLGRNCQTPEGKFCFEPLHPKVTRSRYIR